MTTIVLVCYDDLYEKTITVTTDNDGDGDKACYYVCEGGMCFNMFCTLYTIAIHNAVTATSLKFVVWAVGRERNAMTLLR